ncbi:phosphomannomutase/phosphoglucomutase [Candidatus Kuenenbacteria bacterium CG_4_9_14_3_um_filter_39_14]|uniref:Phosphomannomutase/phosphoglucomutase n=6 Tax=Candidatus Kueneniibacteriota TaxID=1752740 RepID=A0A2M7IL96_9BACT|nr:MAG: phosphomannomutase/phosphoglucomutase [Candidatus Kuenenbacteria bacterium CG23_combo_of_CG06-09_8_20_14_all_39_39]PIP75542.1 MAG: phosphomannomutase/phosphoglucomutase [Candidatus Kuenenbacteria bacterium CG22_combo_CG10-13_8_21_14_all_39_9]PIR80854.1 MAG: phosphomannomutase/phosphoglucomutase [Candidatus Kuenenbacteria bacterium CG10_big_fil_rev_8_21_14_0_10_39_14]PIW95639.1 MAG: phosphomannomutase/phosphoglucomutase [Candidatus Kuenenbacteria bacterium CG_4_8_14_3_um_filter_39_15]PIX
MINPKIFKAYDIRGICPDELNVETAYLIGRAFAQKTKVKQVVVGRDMRHYGEILKKSLIQGLTDEGVREIVDVGLVPIDAIYASVGIFGYEAGIMVTASHNPKEYNGFKMVKKNMVWITGKELLPMIKKNSKAKVKNNKNKVRIIKKNLYPEYIKHVLGFAELKKIKPLKVVIDAGNGMAGKVMPLLAKHLPIKIIPMNFKLDGNFPAHPSNPLDPKSQIGIAKKVKSAKTDFGMILDGDTDRLFFIDEKGKFVRADITLLLLAKLFLEREPGKGISYNLICSKIVPEMIKKWGGQPIRTPVGYVNVSNGMRKNNGIMGGELSAHYSFRDNAYADSGFIALIILLELLSKDNRPLSEIVKPFYKYYKLPEINTPVKDVEIKLKKIKKKYKKYKQDSLDGTTVDNWQKGGWWFNVRPSNTEPLLRLTIEGKNKKTVDQLKKELVALIKK